jgi:hypothetical protein
MWIDQDTGIRRLSFLTISHMDISDRGRTSSRQMTLALGADLKSYE